MDINQQEIPAPAAGTQIIRHEIVQLANVERMSSHRLEEIRQVVIHGAKTRLQAQKTSLEESAKDITSKIMACLWGVAPGIARSEPARPGSLAYSISAGLKAQFEGNDLVRALIKTLMEIDANTSPEPSDRAFDEHVLASAVKGSKVTFPGDTFLKVDPFIDWSNLAYQNDNPAEYQGVPRVIKGIVIMEFLRVLLPTRSSMAPSLLVEYALSEEEFARLESVLADIQAYRRIQSDLVALNDQIQGMDAKSEDVRIHLLTEKLSLGGSITSEQLQAMTEALLSQS